MTVALIIIIIFIIVCFISSANKSAAYNDWKYLNRGNRTLQDELTEKYKYELISDYYNIARTDINHKANCNNNIFNDVAWNIFYGINTIADYYYENLKDAQGVKNLAFNLNHSLLFGIDFSPEEAQCAIVAFIHNFYDGENNFMHRVYAEGLIDSLPHPESINAKEWIDSHELTINENALRFLISTAIYYKDEIIKKSPLTSFRCHYTLTILIQKYSLPSEEEMKDTIYQSYTERKYESLESIVVACVKRELVQNGYKYNGIDFETENRKRAQNNTLADKYPWLNNNPSQSTKSLFNKRKNK